MFHNLTKPFDPKAVQVVLQLMGLFTSGVQHRVQGLLSRQASASLQLHDYTVVSVVEIHLSPASIGILEKLCHRWEFRICFTWISAKHSQHTLIRCLGAETVSSFLPCHLLLLTTRRWLVDSSALLFT